MLGSWPWSQLFRLTHNRELSAEPSFECRDDVALLGVGQGLAPRNLVPFRETAAAAGRGGVLRDEYRMTAEGRLLAVVARRGRRESASNELFRLDENPLESTLLDVVSLRGAEAETAPKRRVGEGSEEFVERSHHTMSPAGLRAPSTFGK